MQTGKYFGFLFRKTHALYLSGGVNRQNCSKRPVIRRSGSPRTPRGFHARPRAVLHPRSRKLLAAFPATRSTTSCGQAAGPRPYWKPTIISAGAIADRIALSTTTVSPWRAATRRKQPTRQSGVKGRRAVANSCKVFHRSSSVQRASVRLFETRNDRPVALQVIPYLYERCLRDLLRRRIAKVFAEPSEGFKSMRVYTKSFRSSGVKLPRNLSILFPQPR